MIRFEITLEPTAKERHRTRGFVAKGKVITQQYNSKKQRIREQQIIEKAAPFAPPEPFAEALMLGVRVYAKIPKSTSKAKREMAATGQIRPETKPDLDNYIKQIKDALNGLFWADDKYIVGYLSGTGKYYSDSPRWDITVVPLAEMNQVPLRSVGVPGGGSIWVPKDPAWASVG